MDTKERSEKDARKGQQGTDSAGYNLRISVRCDQSHLDIVDAVAKKHGQNRNEVMRRMIDEFGKAARTRGII